MPVVGLTGGIASGKSTVARVFAARGGVVMDADAAAREVAEPGGAAFGEIVRHFGPGILGPGGSLDRGRLADLVFRDAEARTWLEERTHPHILRLLSDRVSLEPGDHVIVIEATLLFETLAGWEGSLRPEAVVVVFSPPELQLERLTALRGLSREAALARVMAQGPWEPRLRSADYLIDNQGSVEQLQEAAAGVWESLTLRLSAG